MSKTQINEHLEIGEWQGRIIAVNTKEWDSQTLASFSVERLMLVWNYEFTLMTLPEDNLEICEPQDSLEETAFMQEKVTDWANFLSLFEEGAPDYAELFADVHVSDDEEMYEAWYDAIEEVFSKPIKANLIEGDYGFSTLTILSLEEEIGDYGILAICKTPKGSAVFPLCDCEPLSLETEAENLITSYVIWYANK